MMRKESERKERSGDASGTIVPHHPTLSIAGAAGAARHRARVDPPMNRALNGDEINMIRTPKPLAFSSYTAPGFVVLLVDRAAEP